MTFPWEDILMCRCEAHSGLLRRVRLRLWRWRHARCKVRYLGIVAWSQPDLFGYVCCDHLRCI